MDKTQVIQLAKTALLCSKSPSELAGLDDPEIAFAFNWECADILNAWEMEREFEREKRQLELLTGQAMTQTLGGGQVAPQNKVDRW